MLIARPCSSIGNVSRRMACATIIIVPPPTPWITRNATSTGRLRARPHAIEASVKAITLAM